MKNYLKALNREPRERGQPRPETVTQPALANAARRMANVATRMANAVTHRQQQALGAGVAVA